MNLRQLRYISEVVRNGLNVSATADSLYTSQPGVSKQIRLLEEELGVQIFERSGKQLKRVTPAGEAIIKLAERALVEVEGIRRVSQEFSDPAAGTLSIATTHTQARYVLPPIVREFVARYPRVSLQMHQGTPMQIAELVEDGTADFAIATETLEHAKDLVMMPCYNWNRAIVTTEGHPLLDENPVSLKSLASYPIVTYVFGFIGASSLDRAFRSEGLTPKVTFTATDAEVIKTYVRMGLGVGIIAKMAYYPEVDTDLRAIDASHLFDFSTTRVGFRRSMYLRGFMYDFIELFAPHLTREVVDASRQIRARKSLDAIFMDMNLPTF